MNTLKLSAALLSATAALATVVSLPAQAQYYGYGYPQPVQRRQVIMPTHSGGIYQLNQPIMQRPSFGLQRQLPSQHGYGHSSGNYFGWQ
jgi:hypothetical protein